MIHPYCYIHIVTGFSSFLKLNSTPLYVSLMSKFQVQNYFFHPHDGFIKSLTKAKEITIFRQWVDSSVGKLSSKGQQTFEKEIYQLFIRDRHSTLRVFWTSKDSSPLECCEFQASLVGDGSLKFRPKGEIMQNVFPHSKLIYPFLPPALFSRYFWNFRQKISASTSGQQPPY